MFTDWRTASFSFSNGACVEIASWRKSCYSMSDGQCVEAAQASGAVGVRDTQDRSGPVLTFSAGAWRDFTTRLRVQ